ncbi:hypothetical protein FZ063_12845 [Listeria monocytogenes]|uniref:hypothetical protein n=1 Tax=Listeria monocytogenes TaxID=1639 RepID=UPI0011EB3B90|nr:hypothetical protein [Listeria monocytogenes]TYV42654.1 hypothetical protein FZ063_12845 [Listeria monocytogenes]
MKLKEGIFFKIVICFVTIFICFTPLSTSVSAHASVNREDGKEENTLEQTVSVDKENPDLFVNQAGENNGPRMLFANQTESGGSKYKFVTKQTVSLAAASSIVGGGASLLKKYNYMRQTIYKYSTKKEDKYKVINEYLYTKNGKPGKITTSYSTVRK